MVLKVIPAESIPRVYFLLKTIEIVPSSIKIRRGGHISFKSVISYIKSNDQDFYNTLLEVYKCDDDSCLSKAMTNTFIWFVGQYISLSEIPSRIGELDEGALMEQIRRSYSTLKF